MDNMNKILNDIKNVVTDIKNVVTDIKNVVTDIKNSINDNRPITSHDQTGADPGFPIGKSSRRGRQHTILPNFPKNCTKLRQFWSGGLRSTTVKAGTEQLC